MPKSNEAWIPRCCTTTRTVKLTYDEKLRNKDEYEKRKKENEAAGSSLVGLRERYPKGRRATFIKFLCAYIQIGLDGDEAELILAYLTTVRKPQDCSLSSGVSHSSSST